VLADDSGLEVDALGGKPGVRSARFATDERFLGEPAMTQDQRNNACLLARLSSDENPTARYRCVLALARDGVTEIVTKGAVEGQILRTPRGTGGFGYDPLFWLPQMEKTMAEIDLATKQKISHRGQALLALLQKLA